MRDLRSRVWQVEVEEALAFCTSCLGKRGTFVQSAQISSTEVDDVGSQTAKVFEGEFKGFHVVLNLITGRHNSHKRNLRFPEPDSGACRDRTFLSPLFVPLGSFRVGSDPLAIDHKRQ